MQTQIKIEAVHALLPSQQGLLVDSLAGEGDTYRQQICIELFESMTTSALKNNILRITKHHELLRTIFDWSDEEPLRIVVSGIEPSVLEFSADNERSLLKILTHEKASLKPVNETPAIRFAIIQSRGAQLLAITYHHILLDGPSVDILIKQIITGEITASSPGNAYLEWFKNNIGDNERTTWKSLLATVGKNDGTIAQFNENKKPKIYTETLMPNTYTQIIKRSKDLRVTPAVYIQSIWSAWAKSFFRKDSLLYGLVISTRTPELTDNIIGPYISTIPWTVTNISSDFNELVQQTNNRMLDIQTAKHLALGDIAKHTSPLSMSFDSILTITTRPVQDTSLYKIVATSEKTGYALSVDIEVSTDIVITFSTPLEDMDDAIKSFCIFFEAQIYSSSLVEPSSYYSERAVSAEDLLPHIETRLLMEYVGDILDLVVENIDPTVTFLDAGGDSITALRLKAMLRNAGFDVSVGNILKASSLNELAQKVHILNNDSALSTHEIPEATRTELETLYSNLLEDMSRIPPAALAVVKNYRSGFGQDYHEQTAFQLKGILDRVTIEQSLQLLSRETPTLRLTYPAQFTDMQILLKEPRTYISFTDTKNQTFEAFAEASSIADWSQPYDLESGPLLRVTVAHADNSNTYLFMSFSAIVTDGWSFSILLERFFCIYTELLAGTYTAKTQDSYFEYSKRLAPVLSSRDDQLHHAEGYEDVITGENFVIERRLTQSVMQKSNISQSTISEVLLRMLETALMNDGFSQIEVYENGRNDIHHFTSVGPYSFLSHREIAHHGKKRAYYVFENYPKDSENRLKHGQVPGFNEHGNWRKDLLPPGVDAGFLFDATDGTINVRILVRGSKVNHGAYWKNLLAILERE